MEQTVYYEVDYKYFLSGSIKAHPRIYKYVSSHLPSSNIYMLTVHKKYEIDIPGIICITRYTIQGLQLYVNGNILFNNNPLISDEKKTLKISSLWHFVDFDFAFFKWTSGSSRAPHFFLEGPENIFGPLGPYYLFQPAQYGKMTTNLDTSSYKTCHWV